MYLLHWHLLRTTNLLPQVYNTEVLTFVENEAMTLLTVACNK